MDDDDFERGGGGGKQEEPSSHNLGNQTTQYHRATSTNTIKYDEVL